MSLKPLDWNVVVVGRWNLAILTPAGIRKYMFGGLPEATQLRIAVPLDGISPYMIEDPNNEITVIPSADRIVIKLQKEDYRMLRSAMQAGVKVLSSLPETPVSAAGFNIRFIVDEIPLELIDVANSTIDQKLATLNYYNIVSRTISRSISYNDGLMNLVIDIKEDSVSTVVFNFHQGSNDRQKLINWLNLPVEDIELKIGEIIQKLGLDIVQS
jgi:hypothetical protein